MGITFMLLIGKWDPNTIQLLYKVEQDIVICLWQAGQLFGNK